MLISHTKDPPSAGFSHLKHCTMANKIRNHNRFEAELDTNPSQLQEALWDLRQQERERLAAGWRRNLSFLALALVLALAAILVMR